MPFDFEEYAKDNLEKVKLTSTNQITATCPWCEKFGSFYIDKTTGDYICFKCDNRGKKFIGVIAHVEGVSYSEARNHIFKKSVKFRRRETTRSLLEWIQEMRKDKTDIEVEEIEQDLPDGYEPVFKDGKWRFPSYLKKRKIKKQTARDWDMGFCNWGDFYGRIIIPFECPNGKSFVARDATEKSKIKIKDPEHVDKSKLLFGWHMISPACDVVICEGPFDAVKLWQHGLPALALLGKILHPAQKSLLFKRPKDSAVTVMLDPEENEAPYDVAAQLLCHFENIYIAKLDMGIDPGKSTKVQAYRAYDNAVRYTGERSAMLSRLLSASRESHSF